MYKKLMFLISLVCLLGLSAGARAEELECGCGETVIIDSAVEIEDFQMECDCVIIVTSTGTFTVNEESTMGGGSGDTPRLIIDGGVMYMNDRVNVGKDGANAYIDIINGGYFEHHGNKMTIPDDSGGDHILSVLDGQYYAEETEMIWDRDAWAVVGCVPGTKLVTCKMDEYDSRDPAKWLEEDALECDTGCVGPYISELFEWAGEDCKEVTCKPEPNHAYDPGPPNEATAVCPDTCLTWKKGGTMGGHPGDKHYIFFGKCPAGCDAIIGDPGYRGFKPVGLEEYCPNEDPDLFADLGFNMELWTTYCWRIDEKPFGLPTIPGKCWTYTTGCALMTGDINLDCLVDGTDYAMLADDWMVISMFPDDF
jgi:hypothetical protein